MDKGLDCAVASWPCAFLRLARPRAFYFSGRRLADLLELSLKVDNPPLLFRCILQQVSVALGPFCQRLSQYNKVFSTISITYNQVTTTCRGALTVSALLMVMMLVRKA
jgi:hypothetical protein